MVVCGAVRVEVRVTVYVVSVIVVVIAATKRFSNTTLLVTAASG